MARVEKTVFLSYRRTNFHAALLVYQDLRHHGYDVFMDYQGLSSGDFEQGILENIRSRAHFVVLLTPSALESCAKPGDWLRREIEAAIDNRRNIVPLMLEGFDFGAPAIAKQLTGKLAGLRRYNGLEIPATYFLAAMDRLRNQYLNVALDMVLHPASAAGQEIALEQKIAANAAPSMAEEKLSALQYFERGYAATEPSEQIRMYTEAIRLNPLYVEAFLNRGVALHQKGDFNGAMWDYDEGLRLNPTEPIAYSNRGLARQAMGDMDGALNDYDEALRLNPNFADACSSRGLMRKAKGDLEGALRDFDEALRLDPDDFIAYNNRGLARFAKGDVEGALRDYNEALRLDSNLTVAYVNRGITRHAKHDLEGTLKDCDQALRLDPNSSSAYFIRGLARSEKGDLDGSLRDYEEALRINPNDPDVYFIRGLTRAQKDDLDGALSDYNAAIRLKPNFANAFRYRGRARDAQCDFDGATADYQSYLDLGGGEKYGDTEEVKRRIADLKQ